MQCVLLFRARVACVCRCRCRHANTGMAGCARKWSCPCWWWSQSRISAVAAVVVAAAYSCRTMHDAKEDAGSNSSRHSQIETANFRMRDEREWVVHEKQTWYGWFVCLIKYNGSLDSLGRLSFYIVSLYVSTTCILTRSFGRAAAAAAEAPIRKTSKPTRRRPYPSRYVRCDFVLLAAGPPHAHNENGNEQNQKEEFRKIELKIKTKLPCVCVFCFIFSLGFLQQPFHKLNERSNRDRAPKMHHARQKHTVQC